jgi:hypothetical protein
MPQSSNGVVGTCAYPVLPDQRKVSSHSAPGGALTVGTGTVGLGCREVSAGAARNQAHLRQILREYEIHRNRHRPHRFLHVAAPLKPLPEPVDLE